MVYVETFLPHVYRISKYFSCVKYNIYVIILLSCIETRFCSISFSPLSFELRALRNIYSALAYPTIPVSKLPRFKKQEDKESQETCRFLTSILYYIYIRGSYTVYFKVNPFLLELVIIHLVDTLTYFGLSYLCVMTFSHINVIKSEFRGTLSNDYSEHCLRSAVSDYS